MRNFEEIFKENPILKLLFAILIGIVTFWILGFIQNFSFSIQMVMAIIISLLIFAIIFWPSPRSPHLHLSPRKAKKIYREHYLSNGNVLKYSIIGTQKIKMLPCVVIIYANPRHSDLLTKIEAKWDNAGKKWPGPQDKYLYWYEKALEHYKKINPDAHNGLMLRLMNISVSSDNTLITCGVMQSRYFYTAATNRLADYRFPKEIDGKRRTIREIFEPGPKLSNISDSQAGNHLGVNILVLTKDKQLIFKKREKRGVRHRIGELDSSGSGAIDLNFDLKKGVRDIIRYGSIREFRHEIGENIPIENDEVCFLGLCREFERLGKPDAFFFAKTPMNFKEIIREWDKRPLEHREGVPIPFAFDPDDPKQAFKILKFIRWHLSCRFTHFLQRINPSFAIVSLPLAINLILLCIYLGSNIISTTSD